MYMSTYSTNPNPKQSNTLMRVGLHVSAELIFIVSRMSKVDYQNKV